MTDHPDFVKVRFVLEQDTDGYPPFESEGLWTVPVRTGGYRIDNAPWFARDVAVADVFAAAPDADGTLWAGRRLEASGNCTVRVIVPPDGALAGDQQAVLDTFRPMGVTGEGFGSRPIVALTVPPTADLSAVKSRLESGEADGSWGWEEGCTTEQWRKA